MNNGPGKENEAKSREQSCNSYMCSWNEGLAGNCGIFRVPKMSELCPRKFLKRFGGKVAIGFRLKRRYSSKETPTGRSKRVVTPFDSGRNKAIEDCIEFINSSSLPRCNSVSLRSG
ncbi:hypothetical protein ACFE04_015899 [Oxalis oulophora]